MLLLNIEQVHFTASRFHFFFISGLRPFQEYFTYIEPIVDQKWAKTVKPGEKHLTIRKQNLAFPHVIRVRLELLPVEQSKNC